MKKRFRGDSQTVHLRIIQDDCGWLISDSPVDREFHSLRAAQRYMRKNPLFLDEFYDVIFLTKHSSIFNILYCPYINPHPDEEYYDHKYGRLRKEG